MASLAAVLILLATSVEPAGAGLAEVIAAGDAHYARRAEGASAGVAAPGEIDAAIVEYRRALAIDAFSLEARLRLLRAYFFRGGFCGAQGPAQVAIFDEAKALAEETVRQLDRRTGRDRGRVASRAGELVPSAAAVYLWAAVSWGQWAVAHAASAAWQRAPGRIRDLAQAAATLDPASEQAGAHVVLGRLHAEAPRIPFLTMWVDRRAGVEHLRTALGLSPDSPQIQYFLAQTLLRLDPDRTAEAVALLRRCASQVPRREFPVEDEHYARLAHGRLNDLAGARR
jgi:tetratricopeptide (TPR) repeat protein